MKKRITALMLSTAMLVPMMNFTVSAADTLEGWKASFVGNADGEIKVDKEIYHSGDGSMKLVNRSETAPNVYVSASADVEVEAGKTYEIGGYFKADRISNVFMTVSWGERYSLTPLGSTYDWTLYKIEYTATETGTKSFMINTDNVTNALWVDDVFFKEKGTDENLLENSGFDSGKAQVQTTNKEKMPLEDIYYNIIGSEMFSEEDYINVRGGLKYMPVYEADNITVDGDISDWESYPELAMPTLSTQFQDYIIDERPHDVEAVCKVAYDEENFYLLVDVEDDNNTFIPDSSIYWRGDSLQMAIGNWNESYGEEIGFAYDPTKDECKVYAGAHLAAFIGLMKAKASVKEEGGVLYEIAIPWQAKFSGRPDSFMFNILINDNDGDGRRYCVELAPGISEGKSNALFPLMQLLPGRKEMYGWIQGARSGLTTDNYDFEYFIVNSGETREFVITNGITGKEEKVKIPSGTGIRRSFSAKAPGEGEQQIVLHVKAGEEEMDVVHNMIINLPPPTKADGLAVKAKVEEYAREIEELIAKCNESGIPTDYELINLRVLEEFIGQLEEDCETGDLNLLDYTEKSLNEVYTSAKTSLESYLSGEAKPKSVTKYVTSPVTVNGQSLVATTDTYGLIEERPVFFVGYGHFYEWIYPMLDTFPDLGTNVVQVEVGPSKEIVTPVIFNNWIDNKMGANLKGEIRVEDTHVKSGSHSLAFSMQTETTPQHYMTVYNTVDVDPGEEYTLEGWVKADGLTNVVINTNNWEQRHNLDTGTYDWKKVEYTFTTAENQDQSVIRIICDGKVNNLYFDDFKLIKTSTGEDILKNGGFEELWENEDFYVDTTRFKDFERLLKKAEENNISVCLLISPHYFPDFLFDKYPEIKYVDVSFIKFNVNHPKSREVIEAHLRAICEFAKQFDCIDSICVSNEPYFRTQNLTDFYMPLWHEYLKEIYENDISKLNASYGTSYVDFTEVDMYTNEEQPSKVYDIKIFNDIQFSGWHKWMVDIIREILPGMPLHMKTMPHTGHRVEKSANVSNGTGQQFYDFYDLNGNDAWNYLTDNRGTLIKEMWYDFLMSHKEVSIANTEDHIIPDRDTYYGEDMAPYVAQDIWQGGIHGRGITTIWSWFRSHSPTADSAGSVLFRPDAIRDIAYMGYDLNRLSYEVTAVQEEPWEVGILYTDESALSSEGFEINLYESYASAVLNGKKARFILEAQLEKLNGAKILIIPAATRVMPETVDAIVKYIENGGKVVMIDRESLTLTHRSQPNDVEKTEFIRNNSVILERVTDNEEALYEFRQTMRGIFEEEKLNYVTITDLATGKPAHNVEYNIGVYNGKVIVNMINYGENKNVSVSLNGETVTNSNELRFEKEEGESILLEQYIPKIIEFETDNPFFDTYGHWAESNIAELASEGVVNGVSASRFAPQANITRAEFLALLTRNAGISESEYKGAVSDVSSDKWYANTVQGAINAGVISSENFRPDEPITREEMCDLAVRVLEYKNGVVSEGTFSFTDSGEITLPVQVGKAVASGIMEGMADGSFAPQNNSTRAEAVTVIKRMRD